MLSKKTSIRRDCFPSLKPIFYSQSRSQFQSSSHPPTLLYSHSYKMPFNEEQVQGMIQHAEKCSLTHQPLPTFTEMKASMPPGASVVMIVTCCDPRVLPDQFFGGIGMKISEIRNAGGRASEALRSIICVDHMIGVGGVIVIHHTDCGLTHLRNDYLHSSLTEKAPEKAAEVAKMDFGEILDLEASVIEDMKILKDSPYLRKDLKVYGYVYDIKTGKLQEVKQ
ncbi:carbonic anhydrase [Trichoderma barbatum]